MLPNPTGIDLPSLIIKQPQKTLTNKAYWLIRPVD
jgi:hypothetical protein